MNQSVRNGGRGRRDAARFATPFSSIRTLTVGFGVSPNLLTPSDGTPRGARGLERQALSPPVGTFTPPRERVPPTGGTVSVLAAAGGVVDGNACDRKRPQCLQLTA